MSEVIYLELEALTDLSLSSTNQTFGQSDSHDYIPGRTLWGAIASIAYRKGMAEEKAFRLFHQGAVQISDGVPLKNGCRTYPSPISWHHPKENPGAEMKNFILPKVRDRALKERQHKGKAVAWLTPNLQPVTVAKNFSLRTAVDSTGKARDGLLYGLPVVCAGQRFSTHIRGSKEDLAEIKSLLQGADLRLGRSRNSELGLVRVKFSDKPKQLEGGKGTKDTISFLCVSRCVFRDAKSGSATLVPSPRHFGLEDNWALDAEASFVRFTRIVHFHGKRTRPEPEVFAIEKGSVFTFKGSGAKSIEDISKKLQDGVGELRAYGYGEVLVSPSWLSEESLKIKNPEPLAVKSVVEPKNDELFSWAKKKGVEDRLALKLFEEASNDASAFREFGSLGSQWGNIRAKAQEYRLSGDSGQKLSDWLDAYFESGKRNISPAWKKAKPELLKQAKGNEFLLYLELLAAACMRKPAEAGKEG